MIKADPIILCHPNIPKPLHGINPRTIFGKEWWDIHRQQAYAASNYCCSACGIPKKEALYHPWLEAHEFYLFDYKKGRVTFDHLVALCHACHNFIHDGRMQVLVANGEMTEAKYTDIINHGTAILRKAGLLKERKKRHVHPRSVAWEDWRMVVDGKEYGPSTRSQREWLFGFWRDWTPEEDDA
jgi:hypothetical protein